MDWLIVSDIPFNSIIQNLAKWYGDRLLWDKVSFSLPRGGVVGVIGANGVGKSTLFKLVCVSSTEIVAAEIYRHIWGLMQNPTPSIRIGRSPAWRSRTRAR